MGLQDRYASTFADHHRLCYNGLSSRGARKGVGMTRREAAAVAPVTFMLACVPILVAAMGSQAHAGSQPSSSLSPEEVFTRASPAVVRIEVYDAQLRSVAQGSGFFLSADGLLATNLHVVEKTSLVTVRMATNATLVVKGIAAQDREADLAILKVDGKNLPFLKLAGDEQPNVGTRVYAIGNPQGLTNTLSEGLVSGVREIAGAKVIQTSAAISPGSSGGPLLTADGAVVGVTAFYLAQGQNLNFAVPAIRVRRLLNSVHQQDAPQPFSGAGSTKRMTPDAGVPGVAMEDSGNKLESFLTDLDKVSLEQFSEAWDALNKKQWGEAARILSSLRESQNRNPVLWIFMAFLHEGLGNTDLMIASLERALELKPDMAFFYGPLGDLLKKAGLFEEALATYKKGLVLTPNSVTLYAGIARAYFGSQQYDKAVSAYSQVLLLKPDDIPSYLYLSVSYFCLAHNADARDSPGGALPRSINPYHEKAVAAFRRSIDLSQDIRFCVEWTQAPTRTLFSPRESEEELRAQGVMVLWRLFRELEDELYILSLMQKMQRPNVPGAGYEAHFLSRIAWEKALTLKPVTPEDHYWRGKALEELDRKPEAVDSYRKAIELNSGYGEAHAALGQTLCAFGKTEDGISAFRAGIKAAPEHKETYVWLADLLVRLGRHDEAITFYRNAGRNDRVGDCLQHLLRYEEAIEAYKAVIAQEPSDRRAYYKMGECLKSLKRDEEAVETYRRTLQLKDASAFDYLSVAFFCMGLERWGEAHTLLREGGRAKDGEWLLKEHANQTVEELTQWYKELKRKTEIKAEQRSVSPSQDKKDPGASLPSRVVP